MSWPSRPYPSLMRLHKEVESVRVGDTLIDDQPSVEITRYISIILITKESS